MSGRIFATPQDAEAAFYEALERADLEAMMAVWAEDEEIVCVHPTGPRLAGLAEVRASWARVFAGGAGTRVQITHRVELAGVMLAVHSVHENFAASGGRRPPAPVVATNVYLRGAAGWRMIVHHASPAPGPAEPSGEAPKILH
jgi:ketosteroid isomerase-like protein